MIGVEALVRWQLPNGARLQPDQFIPLAEDTGLIVPLGRAMLTEACRQAAPGGPSDPARPAADERQPGRPPGPRTRPCRRRRTDPGRHRLAPELLQLELTESEFMGTHRGLPGRAARPRRHRRPHRHRRLRHRLLQPGLPAPTCRCTPSNSPDRSSPAEHRQRPTDDVDLEIVGTVVRLAHILGLSVTAESIETPPNSPGSARLGCDTGQGWLFAAATHPDNIPTLLHTPPWAEPTPTTTGDHTAPVDDRRRR